jgi:hypothetical protein
MLRKLMAYVLSTTLVLGGFSSQAIAGMISVEDALAIEARQSRISAVQALMAREDVQNAFIEMGVSTDEAAERVASLSDQELALLEQQLNELPAGGSALALIGAVFLVLLILEWVGVINIFNKA